MSLDPLLSAPLQIQIHATAAILAMALGAIVLLLRKGTPLHKAIGRTYVGLMLVVATSAIFINEIRLIGPFSPIHIFVPVVYGGLAIAIWRIRKGDVQGHRAAMVTLYFLALMLTGAFTLLPGRRMHDVLFGAAAGWDAVADRHPAGPGRRGSAVAPADAEAATGGGLTTGFNTFDQWTRILLKPLLGQRPRPARQSGRRPHGVRNHRPCLARKRSILRGDGNRRTGISVAHRRRRSARLGRAQALGLPPARSRPPQEAPRRTAGGDHRGPRHDVPAAAALRERRSKDVAEAGLRRRRDAVRRLAGRSSATLPTRGRESGGRLAELLTKSCRASATRRSGRGARRGS